MTDDKWLTCTYSVYSCGPRICKEKWLSNVCVTLMMSAVLSSPQQSSESALETRGVEFVLMSCSSLTHIGSINQYISLSAALTLTFLFLLNLFPPTLHVCDGPTKLLEEHFRSSVKMSGFYSLLISSTECLDKQHFTFYGVFCTFTSNHTTHTVGMI